MKEREILNELYRKKKKTCNNVVKTDEERLRLKGTEKMQSDHDENFKKKVDEKN